VTRCHKGALVTLLVAVLLAAAGCGGDDPPTDVVLPTHASFVLPDRLSMGSTRCDSRDR